MLNSNGPAVTAYLPSTSHLGIAVEHESVSSAFNKTSATPLVNVSQESRERWTKSTRYVHFEGIICLDKHFSNVHMHVHNIADMLSCGCAKNGRSYWCKGGVSAGVPVPVPQYFSISKNKPNFSVN